jgi:hypothetical protein
LARFDDLKPGARVRGLACGSIPEIVQVSRFGADALNIVFRADGRVGERLIYRGEEAAFDSIVPGRTRGPTATRSDLVVRIVLYCEESAGIARETER